MTKSDLSSHVATEASLSKAQASAVVDTCGGLRLSALGREIIAVSGSHYLRMKFGFGSE